MKIAARLSALAGLCLALTGCLITKPSTDPTRFFVLTPLAPSAGPAASAPSDPPPLTIARTVIPTYLDHASITVRKGPHEVQYAEWYRWAERLDRGFQRVLGQNLARLLPPDSIRLANSSTPANARELHVAIERFEADDAGRVALVARWQILSANDRRILKSGQSNLARPGPGPASDPEGMVAAMSEIVADFARELAPLIAAAGPGPAAR